ncbi:MAG TPA: hypothetical protein PLL28_08495 [Chitinophagales bacterium]|nr:hypothetical protein [Chitinophagales bacterium]HMX05101.1 hypothetical protein [Chitinophagales bacterium]HMZ89683.1 hypothetical protein [Chitinophagales bacterium]HNE46377.1 hypothetical protein [Chitinophagales bacterium]HNF69399.1 hypothetical protein [Chitinophagales bacterium]
MHTRIFTFMILCAMATAVKAQNNELHAVGIRFGGGDGVGAEISFQQYIGGPNRLEFDLGAFEDGYNDGFKLTVLYQWVHSIDNSFYWYAGLGGGLGARDHDNGHPFEGDDDDGVFVDFDFDLGMEYNFDFPLQLSLDIRPEIGLINDDFDMGWALGVRYRF